MYLRLPALHSNAAANRVDKKDFAPLVFRKLPIPRPANRRGRPGELAAPTGGGWRTSAELKVQLETPERNFPFSIFRFPCFCFSVFLCVADERQLAD